MGAGNDEESVKKEVDIFRRKWICKLFFFLIDLDVCFLVLISLF